jgi:hypothetical protein
MVSVGKISVDAAVVWHLASALRYLILEDKIGWIYWRSATLLLHLLVVNPFWASLCSYVLQRGDLQEAVPADLQEAVPADLQEAVPADLESLEALLMEIFLDAEGS